ncbi:hypothetical protein QOT17_022684 [Balamuthia mandrillaris]
MAQTVFTPMAMDSPAFLQEPSPYPSASSSWNALMQAWCSPPPTPAECSSFHNAEAPPSSGTGFPLDLHSSSYSHPLWHSHSFGCIKQEDQWEEMLSSPPMLSSRPLFPPPASRPSCEWELEPPPLALPPSYWEGFFSPCFPTSHHVPAPDEFAPKPTAAAGPSTSALLESALFDAEKEARSPFAKEEAATAEQKRRSDESRTTDTFRSHSFNCMEDLGIRTLARSLEPPLHLSALDADRSYQRRQTAREDQQPSTITCERGILGVGGGLRFIKPRHNRPPQEMNGTACKKRSERVRRGSAAKPGQSTAKPQRKRRKSATRE